MNNNNNNNNNNNDNNNNNKKTALTQLEADVLAKQSSKRPRATAPGAQSSTSTGATTGVGGKMRPSVAAARPGAVRVSGGAESLQRDVAAKQAGRSTSAAASSNLSQLEQDVLAKQQIGRSSSARPGAVSVGGAASLQRLEQDIAAKQRAGVSASAAPSMATSTAPSSLQRLEQDIAAKQRSTAAPASRPGAVSVTGGAQSSKASGTGASTDGRSQLAALERDIAAKQRPAPAVRPGAVSVTDSSVPSGKASGTGARTDGQSQLAALERDMAAKQRGGPAASRPGAVSVTDSSSSVSGGKASGTGARTDGQSQLAALERDMAAKQRGAPAASRPGVVSVTDGSTDGRRTLRNMEQDLLAKTQSSGPSVAAAAHHPAAASGRRTLQDMEQDLMAKSQSAGPPPASKPGVVNVRAQNSLQQLEANIARKSAGLTASSSPARDLDTLVQQKQQQQQQPHHQNAAVGARESLEALESNVISKAAPPSTTLVEEISYDHPYDDGPAPLREDAVADVTYGVQSASIEVAHDGGIVMDQGMPFFAETVVDATGVAVISGKDEVDEEWEKTNLRKMVLYVVVAFVVLAVAIIVPVVLKLGGGDEPLPPAEDTAAPTLAPTMAPTTNSFPEFIQQFAGGVSLLDDLQQPGTPQNLAARWLDAEYNENTANNPVKTLQRYVLAVFYFAMDGDNSWQLCSRTIECFSTWESWLSPSDECEWAAVECGDDGNIEVFDFVRVENEHLNNNEKDFEGTSVFSLQGKIPKELLQLSDLVFFKGSWDLNFAIDAPLDFFAGFPKLLILELSHNPITGSISDTFCETLTDLRTLLLDGTKLSGSISTRIELLQGLTRLDMDETQLEGPIPAGLGNLTKLEQLSLQSTGVEGPIPPELFNAVAIQELNLESNPGITGEIPTEIGQMENLYVLRMGNTGISGKLPSELYQLPLLDEFLLGYAQLDGELSPDFSRLNQTLTRLDLRNNSFVGEIPTEFGLLTNLNDFFLTGNPGIRGSVPKSVCERRGKRAGIDLVILEVDCHVNCSCCGIRPDGCY